MASRETLQGCLRKLPGEAGGAAWKTLWHFVNGIKVKDVWLAGKPQQEGGAVVCSQWIRGCAVGFSLALDEHREGTGLGLILVWKGAS